MNQTKFCKMKNWLIFMLLICSSLTIAAQEYLEQCVDFSQSTIHADFDWEVIEVDLGVSDVYTIDPELIDSLEYGTLIVINPHKRLWGRVEIEGVSEDRNYLSLNGIGIIAYTNEFVSKDYFALEGYHTFLQMTCKRITSRGFAADNGASVSIMDVVKNNIKNYIDPYRNFILESGQRAFQTGCFALKNSVISIQSADDIRLGGSWQSGYASFIPPTQGDQQESARYDKSSLDYSIIDVIGHNITVNNNNEVVLDGIKNFTRFFRGSRAYLGIHSKNGDSYFTQSDVLITNADVVRYPFRHDYSFVNESYLSTGEILKYGLDGPSAGTIIDVYKDENEGDPNGIFGVIFDNVSVGIDLSDPSALPSIRLSGEIIGDLVALGTYSVGNVVDVNGGIVDDPLSPSAECYAPYTWKRYPETIKNIIKGFKNYNCRNLPAFECTDGNISHWIDMCGSNWNAEYTSHYSNSNCGNIENNEIDDRKWICPPWVNPSDCPRNYNDEDFPHYSSRDWRNDLNLTSKAEPRNNSQSPLNTYFKAQNFSDISIKKIYPNPTFNQAIVEFSILQKDELSITITNSTGQKFLQKKLGTFNAGIHSFQIKTGDLGLNNGLYHVRLNGLRHTVSQQLVVSK